MKPGLCERRKDEIKVTIAPYEKGGWYFEAVDIQRKVVVQTILKTENAAIEYASSPELIAVLDRMHAERVAKGIDKN